MLLKSSASTQYRAFTGPLVLLAALLAAAPSYGQVYKWVDSNGRINYSSQPPADSEAAKTLKVVDARISVYTPDKSLTRAVEEYRQEKIYQAASENLYAVAVRPACADMGMSPSPQGGCQSIANGFDNYYPYGPAVVYGRFRRPIRLAQAQLPPGAIAGNVAGMNGFIPGNVVGMNGSIAGNVVGMNGVIPGISAFAPAATLSSTRSPRPSFPGRGIAVR